jgi:hypothetical protein
MIGNFPQAFSHIGLINAAWAIAQAQQRVGAAALSCPIIGADVSRPNHAGRLT